MRCGTANGRALSVQDRRWKRSNLDRRHVLSLQRFADDWNDVLRRMYERNAPDDRIAAVRMRAVEDVNYLLTQRRAADGEESARRARGRSS